MSAPMELPLKIGVSDSGRPSILLEGIELSHVLAADGLKIEYRDDDEFVAGLPIVTMKFAPGALTLDFLIDLAEAYAKRGESNE